MYLNIITIFVYKKILLYIRYISFYNKQMYLNKITLFVYRKILLYIRYITLYNLYFCFDIRIVSRIFKLLFCVTYNYATIPFINFDRSPWQFKNNYLVSLLHQKICKWWIISWIQCFQFTNEITLFSLSFILFIIVTTTIFILKKLCCILLR